MVSLAVLSGCLGLFGLGLLDASRVKLDLYLCFGFALAQEVCRYGILWLHSRRTLILARTFTNLVFHRCVLLLNYRGIVCNIEAYLSFSSSCLAFLCFLTLFLLGLCPSSLTRLSVLQLVIFTSRPSLGSLLLAFLKLHGCKSE